VAEAPLLVLAVLLVAANAQGALAPLSSALGLLPAGSVGGRASAEGGLAATVREIRLALQSPDATLPPALTRLVGDFAAYHAVMVGIGAAVTLVLAVAAVRVRRRRGHPAPAEPWRLRGPRLAAATACLGFAAAFAVVTAANLSTYLHPAPALLGFFEGGA
jgi:hypothetical protein